MLIATALLMAASGTDFGVRTVGISALKAESQAIGIQLAPASGRTPDLQLAARIGSQFGRVTSTWRSPERNRRVGGVPNSWHLSGRAIDIARAPSVSHAVLAAAMRREGFTLMESLDEGDHSHFAFGSPGLGRKARPLGEVSTEVAHEASYFNFRNVPFARR